LCVTPLGTVASSSSKREVVPDMSDPIPLTKAQQSSYKPEPCQVCGSSVRVIGWENATVLKDSEQKSLPNRRCANRDCRSNEGTLASPLA